MEFKKEFWIRFGLIFLSILLIFIGLYNFYLDFSSVIENISQSNFSEINFNLSESYGAISFIIIGFLFYFFGRHWRDSLKYITNILISFAVFFITMSIILFAINDKSQEITNSIQPSIDFIIANISEEVISKNFNIRNGDSIKLILSKNINIEKIYVKNISLKQSKIISDEFGFNSFSDDENILFGKIIVSSAYDEISKKGVQFLNAPIPLNLIKSEIEKNGLDLSLLELFDITLLESFIDINNDAYLNILISENSEKKDVIIGNLNYDDVKLIWNNLGIKPQIPKNSQIKITNIILSVILTELENNGVSNLDIPLASLKSLIPNDYKKVLNYDLLNSNVTIRQDEIVRVRDDCINKKIDSKDICQVIELTSYDNFMLNINNMTMDLDLNLPINISDINFSKFNSIEKLNILIDKKTNYWNLVLGVSILLFLFSALFYYGHFKLFKRELVPIHIPYYISKHNLFNFVPTFILLVVIIYIITSRIFIDFISGILSSEISNALNLVMKMPIYLSLINVLNYVLILSGFYLILSSVLYGVFYFLLKRDVKNDDENNNNNNNNNSNENEDNKKENNENINENKNNENVPEFKI